MECPRCHKTFLTALSVCPACGFEPSRFVTTVTASIEKTLPTVNNLASEMFYTAPLSEPLPELKRPTLIEFPNKNNEPEWKKKVRETVRNVQEKRREAESGSLTAPKAAPKPPAVSAPQLNLEIAREREAEQKHPLAARALERIEKSRQSYVATATARKLEPIVETDEEPLAVPTTSRLRLPKSFEPRRLHAVAPLPVEIPSTSPSISAELEPPAAFQTIAQTPSAEAFVPSYAPNEFSNDNQTTSNGDSAELHITDESPSKKLVRKIAFTEDEILASSQMNVSGVEKTSAVGTAKLIFGKAFSAVRESFAVEPRADESKDIHQTTQTYEDFAETESENEVIEEAVEVTEEIAPLWMRFISGAADLGLCFAATALLFLPFGFFSQPSGTEGIFAFAGIGLLVAFIYLTTMTARYATTLGKSVFSMSVVDVESGNVPTFQQAAINSAVYLFGLPLVFIGFLTIPFSAERRAAHDLAAKTIVVRQV